MLPIGWLAPWAGIDPESRLGIEQPAKAAATAAITSSAFMATPSVSGVLQAIPVTPDLCKLMLYCSFQYPNHSIARFDAGVAFWNSHV